MSVLTAGAPPRVALRYQLDTSLARMTPERDHEALVDAVASGRIAAEPDL